MFTPLKKKSPEIMHEIPDLDRATCKYRDYLTHPSTEETHSESH